MKYPNMRLFISALSALAAIGVNAAQVNFTGPDGGFRGEATNWSSGTVPTAADEARLTLAEDRTIDINGDYTIKYIVPVDGTDYGYSFALDHWVYLPFDVTGGTATWLYLP